MKKERITKKITIISSNKKISKDLLNKEFKSYRAVAMSLKIKEEVVVSVREQIGKNSKYSFLAGFGYVKRLTENSWQEPRRLMTEY